MLKASGWHAQGCIDPPSTLDSSKREASQILERRMAATREGFGDHEVAADLGTERLHAGCLVHRSSDDGEVKTAACSHVAVNDFSEVQYCVRFEAWLASKDAACIEFPIGGLRFRSCV